ncbi:cellulose biosynthesis protein BcsG, partial [Leclercia adecarboxylata]|uniref:cellulose biosynthesis protein BcsG n=1 Tax=Leclercia adecarboxylata TaxID=83655 RepID=UPI00234C4F98
AYLLDLAGRFVDWKLIGLCALLVIAYSYVASWVRLSVFCLGGLLWLNLSSTDLWAYTPSLAASPASPAQGISATAATNSQGNDSLALDNWLENFFKAEAARQTQFPPPSPQSAAFDVVVLNVCSLAWDDLDAVGLRDNALLQRMDVVFDRFNSATSY